MKSEKPYSFTLTELVIVLVIVSLLAGLALVRFFHVQNRMRSQEGVSILQEIYGAQKRYRLYHGSYAGTGEIDKLDVTVRTPENFTNLTINNGSGTISCSGDNYNWLASIDADYINSGDYSLFVTTNGQVVCTTLSGGCTDEICLKMGYPSN